MVKTTRTKIIFSTLNFSWVRSPELDSLCIVYSRDPLDLALETFGNLERVKLVNPQIMNWSGDQVSSDPGRTPPLRGVIEGVKMSDLPGRGTGDSSIKSEATKSLIDSTKSLIDSTKSLIDSTKSLIDSPKSLIDSTKSLIDSTESLIDSTKSLIDSTKSLIDSTKSLIDSTKSLIDSTKSLIDSTKSLIDSTKSLIDSTKSLIDSTKSLIDSTKSLVDSTKSLIDGTKALNRVSPRTTRKPCRRSAIAPASASAINVPFQSQGDSGDEAIQQGYRRGHESGGEERERLRGCSNESPCPRLGPNEKPPPEL
ncbi:unnamed protein product [Bemisia tabaci]|uniref:Uncharacterized protein n=1 Tax=Bemisia tabaci TaxID=7038 RepID=A0A9P0A4V7_BEMTA|nr:unnamed protein product [Bemisia tabaci]